MGAATSRAVRSRLLARCAFVETCWHRQWLIPLLQLRATTQASPLLSGRHAQSRSQVCAIRFLSPESASSGKSPFSPFSIPPSLLTLPTLRQDTEPPHLTHSLTQALLPAVQLHLLPKSSLDIYLMVLEAESLGTEAVLAAGLTVASAALADAGIDMGGLAVGVSGALAPGPGVQTAVDPNSQATRDAAGVATVGVLPALGLISDVWMTGEMEVADLVKVRGQRFTRGPRVPQLTCVDRSWTAVSRPAQTCTPCSVRRSSPERWSEQKQRAEARIFWGRGRRGTLLSHWQCSGCGGTHIGHILCCAVDHPTEAKRNRNFTPVHSYGSSVTYIAY